MGVTWQEFWGMNPHIINCLQKGYEERIKQEDYLQYIWWGKYGISALVFAIEHNFAKNPRSEYEKEPILSKIYHSGPITEAEKERELELFIKRNEKARSEWKRRKKRRERAENGDI